MTRAIRLFMFFEGAAFIAAALIHFGLLIDGYDHQKAGTAESLTGIVLLVGWALTWMRPRRQAQSHAERKKARRCLGTI